VKKLISLVLAVVMIMAMFCSPAAVFAAGEEMQKATNVFYYDNFESGDHASFTIQGGYAEETSKAIKKEAGKNNNYLSVTCSSVEGETWLHDFMISSYLDSCSSKDFVFSFDVKQSENPGNLGIACKAYKEQELTNASGTIWLGTVNEDGEFAFNYGKKSKATISKDAWTHFDMVIHASTDIVHNIDLYIDGVKKEANAEFSSNTFSLRQIRLSSSTLGKEVNLDNIAIYEGSEPCTVTNPSAAPAGITYTRTAITAGYAGGEVSITPPANTTGLTGYSVAWANDDGIMVDWKAFPSVAANTDGDTKYTIQEGLLIPPGATKLSACAIYNGEYSDPVYVDITDDLLTLAEEKYNFFTASDTHIGDSGLSMYLKKGFDYFTANRNDKTLGVFGVGDTVNDGTVAQWSNFKSIKDEYFTGNLQWYGTLGNHEFYDLSSKVDPVVLERAQLYGGNIPDFYYYNVIDGKYFIHLYPDYETETQTKWLAGLLDKAQAKGKEAYVFCHFPFENTVSGTFADEEPYVGGLKGEPYTSMYNEIQSHPNAIVFYGHTHYRYRNNRVGNVGNNTYASHFNAGCMKYNSDKSGNSDPSRGFGMYLKGYEDYDIVYGMDYYTGQHDPNASYIVPKTAFKDAVASNADLEEIKVNGEPLVDFDKDVTEYSTTVLGTDTVVTATPMIDGASVYVSEMTSGQVTITCTSKDGKQSKEYKVTVTAPVYQGTPSFDKLYRFSLESDADKGIHAFKATYTGIASKPRYFTFKSSEEYSVYTEPETGEVEGPRYVWLYYDLSNMNNAPLYFYYGGANGDGTGNLSNNATLSVKSYDIGAGAKIDCIIDLKEQKHHFYVNGLSVDTTGKTMSVFGEGVTKGNISLLQRAFFATTKDNVVLKASNLNEFAFGSDVTLEWLQAKVLERATRGTATYDIGLYYDSETSNFTIDGSISADSFTVIPKDTTAAMPVYFYATMSNTTNQPKYKFAKFSTKVKVNSFDGTGTLTFGITKNSHQLNNVGAGILGSGSYRQIDIVYDFSTNMCHTWFDGVYMGSESKLTNTKYLKYFIVNLCDFSTEALTNSYTFKDSKFTLYHYDGNETETIETLKAELTTDTYAFNFATAKYDTANKAYHIQADIICKDVNFSTDENNVIYVAGYNSDGSLEFVKAINDQENSTISDVNKANELKLFVWTKDNLTPYIPSETLTQEDL